MSSHLIPPYWWVDCTQKETCEHVVHYDAAAAVANALPQDWLKALLGFSLHKERGFHLYEEKGYHTVFLVDSEGRYHNDDGPASEGSDGTLKWFQHGEFHRVDGPALVAPGHYSIWFEHGERYRVEAVAVEHMKQEGVRQWWYFDTFYQFMSEPMEHANGTTEWVMAESGHSPVTVTQFADGTAEWFENGHLRHATSVEKCYGCANFSCYGK